MKTKKMKINARRLLNLMVIRASRVAEKQIHY